jgi:hypothetical protein
MNRPELLKKIEAFLDQGERDRTWGTIDIELREGRPTVIRRSYTDKIQTEDDYRGRRQYPQR